MRYLLLLLCVISFTFAASTQTLSAESLAKLNKDEQALVIKALAPETADKKVEQWTSIGTTISTVITTSITETARGLNITVNEFASTPVGKLTIFIIMWKLFISTALTKLFAFVCVFLGPIFVNSIFKRIEPNELYSDVAVFYYITMIVFAAIPFLAVIN